MGWIFDLANMRQSKVILNCKLRVDEQETPAALQLLNSQLEHMQIVAQRARIASVVDQTLTSALTDVLGSHVADQTSVLTGKLQLYEQAVDRLNRAHCKVALHQINCA